MDIFMKLSLLFLLGGFSGWIIECIYRRFAHGKWINPGFLVGPCLPLYGFGLLLLFLLGELDFSFIRIPVLEVLFRIVLQTVILTVIELVTGLIFKHGFKVLLWDYSNRLGNIDGVVCPLFSLLWGMCGAGYFFLIHPKVKELVPIVCSSPVYSFGAGICFGICLVDLFYSFRIVSRLKAIATEKQVILRLEKFKESVVNRREEMKERIHFFFPFLSSITLPELVEIYVNEWQEKGKELLKVIRKKKTESVNRKKK